MSLDGATDTHVGSWASAVPLSLSFGGGENLLCGDVGGKSEPPDKDCIVPDTNLRFGKHFDGSP